MLPKLKPKKNCLQSKIYEVTLGSEKVKGDTFTRRFHVNSYCVRDVLPRHPLLLWLFLIDDMSP